jgi:NOL1/NOP2/sun family putative RNA methylase
MKAVPRNMAQEVFGPYREIIPQYGDFLDALEGELPTTLRVNTLLSTPQAVIRSLLRKGTRLESTALGETFWLAPGEPHPGHLLEHLMGLIYTQTLGSGVPPLALAPEPGEAVLDLCAAPGSKTSQMAQQMENRGILVANEPVRTRRVSLQSNLRRLGAANTLVTAYQGQNFPQRWRLCKILVDAPCCGEGKARIGPSGELKGHRPSKRDFSRIQRALLSRAFDVMSDEGHLVYATCTYDPSENEAVVDALLRTRPARVVPISLDIPHDPGITRWKGERSRGEIQETWRIYPHRLPTVGFFVAKIARR